MEGEQGEEEVMGSRKAGEGGGGREEGRWRERMEEEEVEGKQEQEGWRLRRRRKERIHFVNVTLASLLILIWDNASFRPSHPYFIPYKYPSHSHSCCSIIMCRLVP